MMPNEKLLRSSLIAHHSSLIAPHSSLITHHSSLITPLSTLQRFRLILGGGQSDGTGEPLEGKAADMDAALEALYEFERRQRFEYTPSGEAPKRGGLEKSQPNIARWLGDIRRYFPQSVVQVIQKDALAHPKLKERLLFDTEILEQATADIHLVATLLELSKLMPSKTKDTARKVVQKVVDELLQKISQKTISAIAGAIQRHIRNRRPKISEINWNITIQKNLQHYQPDYRTIIPEILIGNGHKNRRSVKDIVLCLDQSGSMGTSVVYTGVFGAVLASIPSIHTRLIAFNTEVADLTEDLKDPVDLLFGVQLGGGTDIGRALHYCQQTIQRPQDTILVLISDLFEGGDTRLLHTIIAELLHAGVQIICLPALGDDGTPAYDHENAAFLASLDIPVFACTPDRFPDLMAAAIGQQDLKLWAGEAL
jgi:hypothetical protein